MAENAEVKKEELMKRHKRVAFMKIGEGAEAVFHRMRKFTELSESKNPQEYNRQYIDEEGEESDVVGYSTELGYAFDRYSNNPVHKRLATIADDELTGDDAVVSILTVDLDEPVVGGGCEARLRMYSVIPDANGDSTDALTYSGSFKKKGTFEKVSAKVSEDGKTAEILVGVNAE